MDLHVIDDKDRITVQNTSIKVYLNYGQETLTRAHLASKKLIANSQATSEIEEEELMPLCQFKNYHFKCLLDDKTDELVVSLECTDFDYVRMELPNSDCRFLHIELSTVVITKIKDDIKNLQPLSGLNFVTFGMPKKLSDEDGGDFTAPNPVDEFRELDEYQGLPIELINWDGINFEDEEVYGYQPSGNDRGWFVFPEDATQRLGSADYQTKGMLIENLDEYLQKGKLLMTPEVSMSAPAPELEKRKPDQFENMKKAFTQSKQIQPSTSTSGPTSTNKPPMSGAVFRSSGLSNLSSDTGRPQPAPPQQQLQKPQSPPQPKPAPALVQMPMEPISDAQLAAELDDIELPVQMSAPSEGKVKLNPLTPQTAGFAASAAFF